MEPKTKIWLKSATKPIDKIIKEKEVVFPLFSGY